MSGMKTLQGVSDFSKPQYTPLKRRVNGRRIQPEQNYFRDGVEPTGGARREHRALA